MVKIPAQGGRTVETHITVQEMDAPRPPPIQDPPAAKRLKIRALIEIGLPHKGEATNDMSWKRVLKCQKRTDSTPDAPVRSTFDSRYALNRVPNVAAGPGDVEKVAALGIQKTLVAVKSYGYYASVLAHLAEESFNNTVAEHGRLEESWRKTEEDLRACQADKDRLMGDLQKWDQIRHVLRGGCLS